MKQYFFTGLMVAVPLALLLGFLYLLGHGIASLLADWRIKREVEELQAESAARRESRRQANATRLNNGCQHEFDGLYELFPPQVCHKCGLSREKPSGDCDHVWRLAKEAAPFAFCEKCNRKHDASPVAEKRPLR